MSGAPNPILMGIHNSGATFRLPPEELFVVVCAEAIHKGSGRKWSSLSSFMKSLASLFRSYNVRHKLESFAHAAQPRC